MMFKRTESERASAGSNFMHIAFDVAFDAAAAASKLSWWPEASCSRLGGVLDPLEGLLEPQKTS